ncbi:uncharacterized protein LY79DRAFT_559572 [Colletotrichum navitas]|uniref:Uncharacterized protein n=1 Tax=Colletotrichum navitas TaxID=681940 RepID=A0AAD8PVL7_9PEZI|nr:uncharacterized protein LY79DRAFT_559572 [Colletotrichum navitas]KAK1585031.1 hypothetical protein LY79DRAFT_559572 [Colletotrichum navitas]
MTLKPEACACLSANMAMPPVPVSVVIRPSLQTNPLLTWKAVRDLLYANSLHTCPEINLNPQSDNLIIVLWTPASDRSAQSTAAMTTSKTI